MQEEKENDTQIKAIHFGFSWPKEILIYRFLQTEASELF